MTKELKLLKVYNYWRSLDKDLYAHNLIEARKAQLEEETQAKSDKINHHDAVEVDLPNPQRIKDNLVLTKFRVKHPEVDTTFKESYLIASNGVDLDKVRQREHKLKSRHERKLASPELSELGTTLKGMKQEHALHRNGRSPNLIEIIKIARSRKALPNIYDL